MKKSEQTRARILDAATQLIAKKGTSSTRTADVAAAAGVSEGAIFHYFPSKAHVVEAVLKQLLARFTRESRRVLDSVSGLSERAVLESIVDFHFSFFTKEENLALIVIGLTEQEVIDERIMAMVRDGLLPYVSQMAGLLERGMGNGGFRAGDPTLMATALLGLMQMTIFRKLLTGAAYSFDEARDEVKRIFFTGVVVRNGCQDVELA